MVHGASATTQFTRATMTGTGNRRSSSSSKERAACPRTPGRQKPHGPRRAPIGSQPNRSVYERGATRAATRRELPGRSTLRPRAFLHWAAIQIQGGSPVPSSYRNRSVRALFSLSVLSAVTLSPRSEPSCSCWHLVVLVVL